VDIVFLDEHAGLNAVKWSNHVQCVVSFC